MTTENKKVSAYLPEHINKAFKAYKKNSNLKTDSQVLISIIAQFLGLESSVKTTGVTLNEFQNLKIEVSNLKKFYEKYSFMLSEPTYSLLSSLPRVIEKFNSLLEEFNSFKDKLEKLEHQANSKYISKLNTKILSEIEKEETVNNKTILNVKELAQRLQVHNTRIYRHKKTEKFTEWTRQKDPEGIGWIILETGEFVPEGQVLSIEDKVEQPTVPSSESELLSEPDSSTLNDLVLKNNKVVKENLSSIPDTLPSNILAVSGYQLARRLGVKRDLPAQKKKSVSEDKFYEWSKGKDIDQIGWIPDSVLLKGYVPKDELPSELLLRLQEWIEQDLQNSRFKAAASKSKTEGVNINRLLDDTADSLQDELLTT